MCAIEPAAVRICPSTGPGGPGKSPVEAHAAPVSNDVVSIIFWIGPGIAQARYFHRRGTTEDSGGAPVSDRCMGWWETKTYQKVIRVRLKPKD